ncbi:MAG: helicase C-terminal domain-containing protein, partial [Verrucomicrobiales bacterium]|nr:helicase C-terminal domain-containing protein [Verrucomicrobiales bacterium]
CPTRLEGAMATAGDLFTTSETEELRALWEWCQTTRDGTLSDLDFTPMPKVWSQVCSESHACTVKRCGPTGRCFYQEVRKRAGEADVLVMNHMLFFTLLSQVDAFGEGESGFLYPGDFAIFDEAHTLENIAAKQLGLNVSQVGLRFNIQRLYNPKTKKGLFQIARNSEGVKEVMGLMDSLQNFFEEVEDGCEFSARGGEFRVRSPELVENTLAGALFRVQSVAAEAAEKSDQEAVRSELGEMARRMRDARMAVAEFLDQSLEGHVYWVERRGEDRGMSSVSLNAAPVDVGSLLRRVLFGEGKQCLMTSATLSAGDGNLGYFRKRVGAEDVRSLQIGSPFEYERQMKLYVVKSMPEPADTRYGEELIKWIAHFLDESDGRAFVLFTSYRQMMAAVDGLEEFIGRRGWTLLVQGRGKPRHQLLDEFREDVGSVLFGTDSFWTGVDVPGEALSNVIVTRLPFAVPSHPLVASRLEAIEEGGGNSFMEYSVPEAVLKLRQGIGRLIRSGRDEGIAAILDKRVLTKAYGRLFLRAMPVEAEVVEGQASSLD